MKKLVSILSATLLATSLAACGADEEKVVEAGTCLYLDLYLHQK